MAKPSSNSVERQVSADVRQVGDDIEYERADLAKLLDALEPDGRYRVERTLKDVGYETTQIVYRTGAVEAGPFVRKVFASDSGCGQAYARIFQAQVSGTRFAHQPLIYDVSLSGDALSVVMEYVHGKTLLQLVEERGPSVELAISTGIRLCDALAELHEAFDSPVIHRDVKPSNIMLSGERLVLLDLGIAREMHSEARRDTMCFGTPGYAPPEQFGYGQTDARSDVYAAGMVIAFCLTGKNENEALRSREFLDPGVPGELSEILTNATRFDPDARYASAREMGERLRQIAEVVHVSQEQALQSNQLDAKAARNSVGAAPPTLEGTTLAMLRHVWNTVIGVVVVTFAVIVIASMIDPHGEVERYDTWYRVLSYTLMMIVPSMLVGYLLMFKGGFRTKVALLSRLSWKIEIPIAVLVAFLSIAIAVGVGIVSGQAMI